MPDLPKDNLFRSAPAFELRAAEADDGGGMPTMVINFARFNEWVEIDSFWEGNFLEQFAPGSFKKTFREQRDSIRPIFQHGRDPVAGDKPLGPINDLREQPDGAWADVRLLDADYVRQIVPGLEAGVYGASFAFQVVREDVNLEPKKSDDNPGGLPERTVKEVRLREFGPVTFPAYPSTTAGVRSLTDEFLAGQDPAKRRALAEWRANQTSDEPEETPATTATSPLTLAKLRLEMYARRR
jgi:hypothetical protein